MFSTKLVLKIIISVAFAASLLLLLLSYSIAGMVTSEDLAVITQATEYPSDLAVFMLNIEANVVKNVFWLSLTAIGVCLISLYYLYGNFYIFLAPAILSLILFILCQATLAALPGYISLGLQSSVGPVLQNGLQNAQLINYFILLGGLILLGVSIKLKPGK